MTRTFAITLLTFSLVGCVDDTPISLDSPTIGNHVWSRTLGGSGDDVTRDVAVDSAGNVIVVGTYSQTADFGSGTATTAAVTAGFVAKYRGYDGAPLWVVPFDQIQLEDPDEGAGSGAMKIAIGENDRIIVAGYYSHPINLGAGWMMPTGCGGDGFVAVYTSDGALEQQRALPQVQTLSLARAPEDNVFVAGLVLATDCDLLMQNPGMASEFASFITKYDATLDELWTKQFPQDHFLDLADVAAAPNGDVIVTGRYNGTVDFGDGPLVSSVADNATETFVARLTGAGHEVWVRSFSGSGGESSSRGLSTFVDVDNNTYTVGSFHAVVDFDGQVERTDSAVDDDMYLVRLDPLGNRVWLARSFGGWQTHGVEVDASSPDRVFVTGRAGDPPNFGGGNIDAENGAFVVSYDKKGDYVSSQGFTLADNSDSAGFGVATSSTGLLVVAGNFAGQCDFGDGPVNSTGQFFDGFVTVFNPK